MTMTDYKISWQQLYKLNSIQSILLTLVSLSLPQKYRWLKQPLRALKKIFFKSIWKFACIHTNIPVVHTLTLHNRLNNLTIHAACCLLKESYKTELWPLHQGRWEHRAWTTSTRLLPCSGVVSSTQTSLPVHHVQILWQRAWHFPLLQQMHVTKGKTFIKHGDVTWSLFESRWYACTCVLLPTRCRCGLYWTSNDGRKDDYFLSLDGAFKHFHFSISTVKPRHVHVRAKHQVIDFLLTRPGRQSTGRSSEK